MNKIRIYTICTSFFFEEVHIDEKPLFAKNYDLNSIEEWDRKIRSLQWIPAKDLYSSKVFSQWREIVELLWEIWEVQHYFFMYTDTRKIVWIDLEFLSL